MAARAYRKGQLAFRGQELGVSLRPCGRGLEDVEELGETGGRANVIGPMAALKASVEGKNPAPEKPRPKRHLTAVKEPPARRKRA